MTWRPRVAAVLLSLAAVIGCSRGGDSSVRRELQKQVPADAIEALENAESFVLYSLDPNRRAGEEGEKFQRWPVLGHVAVDDLAVRKRLVASLWKGVADNDGAVAGCFNPRHAIRIAYKGRTIEFVICFECLQVATTDGERHGRFLTTASPQPAFDRVLIDSGIALPSKRGR